MDSPEPNEKIGKKRKTHVDEHGIPKHSKKNMRTMVDSLAFVSEVDFLPSSAAEKKTKKKKKKKTKRSNRVNSTDDFAADKHFSCNPPLQDGETFGLHHAADIKAEGLHSGLQNGVEREVDVSPSLETKQKTKRRKRDNNVDNMAVNGDIFSEPYGQENERLGLHHAANYTTEEDATEEQVPVYQHQEKREREEEVTVADPPKKRRKREGSERDEFSNQETLPLQGEVLSRETEEVLKNSKKKKKKGSRIVGDTLEEECPSEADVTNLELKTTEAVENIEEVQGPAMGNGKTNAVGDLGGHVGPQISHAMLVDLDTREKQPSKRKKKRGAKNSIEVTTEETQCEVEDEEKRRQCESKERLTFDNLEYGSQDKELHNMQPGMQLVIEAGDNKREEKLSHKESNGEQYVWGKRFTPEEDEILRQAVFGYIKIHGWDEKEGLKMVLNCSKHKETRKCWAEIQISLPHRPRTAIRQRAHLLLEEGTHLGRWSKEERETLIRLQEEHGCNWRKISALMGRGRANLKEKWRTLKRSKATGDWTQADLQKLAEMVHSFQAKENSGSTKNKNVHRMNRDGISWEKIADEIGTHGPSSCCKEWYFILRSSMVTSGEWKNEDDHLLLQGLLGSGVHSEDDVEWDGLLDYRSGEICMKRWTEMVNHLGENRALEFQEKLVLLIHRYSPDLLKGFAEDEKGNFEP